MLPSQVRILVATRPVDFRWSFDRLSGVIRSSLGSNPRSGALFVFLNRRGDRLKVCFFDGTGDCMLYKRLDRASFRGIVDLSQDASHVEIDAAALKGLIAGVVTPAGGRVH